MVALDPKNEYYTLGIGEAESWVVMDTVEQNLLTSTGLHVFGLLCEREINVYLL